MWTCESCKKDFHEEEMAIDVRFGHVDSELAQEQNDQYYAFGTEQGWGPLCDDCAVAYIKGKTN